LSQNDRIRSFPVVEKGKLVEIATHGDILLLLTKTLGLQEEGVRITIEGLGGRLGELKDIISIFDRHQAAVMSIMTLPKKEERLVGGDSAECKRWVRYCRRPKKGRVAGDVLG
jgi:hypothetical protein